MLILTNWLSSIWHNGKYPFLSLACFGSLLIEFILIRSLVLINIQLLVSVTKDKENCCVSLAFLDLWSHITLYQWTWVSNIHKGLGKRIWHRLTYCSAVVFHPLKHSTALNYWTLVSHTRNLGKYLFQHTKIFIWCIEGYRNILL